MMKKLRLLFLLAILFAGHSRVKAQNSYYDKMNIVLLKNFYTGYIVHFVHDSIQQMVKGMDTLAKGMCTDKLYKRLQTDTTLSLNGDPFLKTPVYVDSMLYTIKIIKDPQASNRYVAKYPYFNALKGHKDTTYIHIQMVEDKIDSLW